MDWQETDLADILVSFIVVSDSPYALIYSFVPPKTKFYEHYQRFCYAPAELHTVT